MTVSLFSTPASVADAVRLIPLLKAKYLSDDPSIFFEDWRDRQTRVIVEVKRNRGVRVVAAAAELPALGLMHGDTNTKDAWADAMLSSSTPNSPDILSWTVSQNSLPNAIITTINNSLTPYLTPEQRARGEFRTDGTFPVQASTREKLLSFINTTWLPPAWQQKFLEALKGAVEILPSTAAPELVHANEQLKSIQGKIEQDVASDAFSHIMAPAGGPDVIPTPTPLRKPGLWAALNSQKNRPWVIMGGGIFLLGLMLLIGKKLKHQGQKLRLDGSSLSGRV